MMPQRIICLSAESADWLWRIGAWDRVVGVTVFFTIPRNCEPKPRVSGFSTARIKEITKLNPDLIITFSDVQAESARELIGKGFTVLATNQRSLAEIESTLALIARVAGREKDGARLLAEFRKRLAPLRKVKVHPRTYFEEWNAPPVSGIGWVAEGAVFSNGWVVLVWPTGTPSLNFYESIEAVEAVHGHGGLTRIVFD